MPPALAADLLVLVHLAFVAFVALGGLLVLRWPKAAWGHLPAVAWGVWIELSGRICPLTPLENALRLEGGAGAYEGDFVGRYVLPVLYPDGLTRTDQVQLGLLVLAINAVIYFIALRRRVSGGSPTRTNGPPRL